MGKREIFFGSFLMALSIVVFALTYQFPQQTMALPPTVFPRFVSVCLFILACILCIQGVIGLKAGSEPSDRAAGALDTKFLARLCALILVAFAYIRLLPHTGYVIATPPFVAGTMLLFNEKRWQWILIISISTSAVLYVVFRMVFKVPLPRFDMW